MMRVSIWPRIKEFSWLGIGGLASALSLLVLSARQLPGLGNEEVPRLLLLLQWHALGWSLTKMGVDYAVFSIVSKHPDRTFPLSSSIRGWSSALVVSFGACSAILYGYTVGIVLSLALFADTLSAIRNAELNARREFKSGAIGNLMYYPLFVISWAAASQWYPATVENGLIILTTCSWMRLAWFATRRPQASDLKQSKIDSQLLPATQGVLNLALFRSDQITLSLILFAGLVSPPSAQFTGHYVYLSKLIDVSTGILVMVGTVLFPLYFMSGNLRSMQFNRRSINVLGLGLINCAILGGVLIGAGMYLYSGPLPAWSMAFPFALQVPLTFASNFLTFSMQRDERFPGLLRNQALSIFLGMILVMACTLGNHFEHMAWVIPLQLMTFSLLCLWAPWGERTRVFGDH